MDNRNIYLHLHQIMEDMNIIYPKWITPSTINVRLRNKKKKSNTDLNLFEFNKDTIEIMRFLDHVFSKGFIEKDEKGNCRITLGGMMFMNKGGFYHLYNVDKDDFRIGTNERTLELSKNHMMIISSIVGWVFATVNLFYSCSNDS